MKSLLALLTATMLVGVQTDGMATQKEKRVTREILRDERGHQVGSVKRENGTEKIYDKNNHYKGEYRSDTNKTVDQDRHRVGSGNQNTKNLER